MSQTRTERYSNIRALLGYPTEQRPNPHQVIAQMLRDEQSLILRLTNTRQAWNLTSHTLTTVAGTSEYTITQPVSGNPNAGKVYFVFRSTGNNDAPFLPIPFDDYNSQEFGRMSEDVNTWLGVPEKISFYRSGLQDQLIKAVIHPTPQSVLIYTVKFYAASLDRTAATLVGVALVPELVDFLDLSSALVLLPYAEWSGHSMEANTAKRKELAAALGFQLAALTPIVDEYIDQINSPATSEMGYWND